jgi:hypothetical protein
VQGPVNIKSEGVRIAVIFIGSALTVHLGYLWELLLKVFRLDNSASAWVAVLLAQVAAFAVFGIVVAWTRWARAEWYMLGSFVLIGLAYYFAADFHAFAYISSALWYGLFASAIANWALKKEFSKNSA